MVQMLRSGAGADAGISLCLASAIRVAAATGAYDDTPANGGTACLVASNQVYDGQRHGLLERFLLKAIAGEGRSHKLATGAIPEANNGHVAWAVEPKIL